MKLKEILQHIRHFEQTGEIREPLIPFFDQNGKWCGDRVKLPSHKIEHQQFKFRKVTQPKARRVAASGSGLILKTSFVNYGDNEVSIDYTEIRGSVLVYGTPPGIRRFQAHQKLPENSWTVTGFA